MVTQLKGCVSLVSILGISWLSGFFYFTTSLHWVGVLFTITNSLQVIGMVIRAVKKTLRSLTVPGRTIHTAVIIVERTFPGTE